MVQFELLPCVQSTFFAGLKSEGTELLSEYESNDCYSSFAHIGSNTLTLVHDAQAFFWIQPVF